MNKSPLSLILIALILVSSAAVITMNFVNAQTGTNVTGIIYSNSTWTQANSPYTLTGNVLVNNGVTLTIQAGTTVNLGGYYIEVNGTLQAIGTSSNEITFNGISGGYITFDQYATNWIESTGTGCIIAYSTLNCDPTGYGGASINIQNTSPKIINCVITDTSGYGIMNGWVGQGGQTSDSPIILNNIITGGIESSGNASISGNTIFGGITTMIDRIINNLICSGGISVYGNCVIQNNTIMNSQIGISGPWQGYFVNPPSSAIAYNNIYSNTKYNFQSYSNLNINATYNWWGTADTQAINQTIYDFKNNFNFGNISFIPFLSTPNPQAPTYITASALTGGSISPNGIIGLSYGGSQTFTITPNIGYHIADVLVNGTSAGAVSAYPLQNVNGATTISATFAPNPTPTPTAGHTANPTSSPIGSPTASPTSSSTASTPTVTPTDSSPTLSSPTPTVPEIPLLLTVLTLFISVSIGVLVIARKRKTGKTAYRV